MLIHDIDLEAVDASIAFDHAVLIVMPDSVVGLLSIDSLVVETAPGQGDLSLRANGSITPRSGDHAWQALSGSPWRPAEEVELAHIG